MRLIVLALLLASSRASADASLPQRATRSPSDFRAFVVALAVERGQHVIDWWLIDLDEQPDLEFVAVLMDDDAGGGDGEFGDYVIGKRNGRRWDVRFYDDGRTRKEREAHAIMHQQGWHHGFHAVTLALRHGRVAVVRDEGVDDATTDEVTSSAVLRYLPRGEPDYDEPRLRDLP